MQGGTDRRSHVRSEAPGRKTETVLASTIKRSGESGPCAILPIGRKMGKEGAPRGRIVAPSNMGEY